jgi:DNA (cytosine-5)-methyltransferase 1
MKSLELFAGIGGIALAEQIAGIEVAGLCEFADYPRQILRKNFPEIPLFKDVTKLDRSTLENGGGGTRLN